MKRILLALAFAVLALLPGSSPTHAAQICVGSGASWHCSAKPWPGAGGTFRAPKAAWVGNGGTWKPFYSTPSVSASNVGGSVTDATGTGTPNTSAQSPNTTLSGSYFPTVGFNWACSANCTGISISNSVAQNPSWSATLSASCQSSNTANSTWSVTATDGIGYQAVSNNITVSLTYTNNKACLGPFTLVTSGSSGSGSGFSNTYTWNGSASVTGFNGGPVSGNMSYSWTYVSGDTAASTSGSSTANLSFHSTTQTCPVATVCNTSSKWNVHVVDLVSGQSADAQVTMTYEYANNNG